MLSRLFDEWCARRAVAAAEADVLSRLDDDGNYVFWPISGRNRRKVESYLCVYPRRRFGYLVPPWHAREVIDRLRYDHCLRVEMIHKEY